MPTLKRIGRGLAGQLKSGAKTVAKSPEARALTRRTRRARRRTIAARKQTASNIVFGTPKKKRRKKRTQTIIVKIRR